MVTIRVCNVGLAGEDAEVGSLLEDVVGLPEHGVGAVGIAEGDVGASQLQQGLDRHHREGRGEQRPQTRRPPEMLPGRVQVAAVQADLAAQA
jgi:hypothetical protein